MDCRKSLVLAFGIAWASCGCLTNKSLLTPGDKDAPAPAAKKDLSPRTPKASTCTAFGDFRSKQALEEKVSPVDREGMLDQARRAYQQALQIDPNYLPAYAGLGRLYASLADYDRAQATYDKALKINPKDAGIWFERGMCYGRQKQWDPALRSLQKAVQLDPENRHFVNTFGLCLARSGRYEDSFKVLQSVTGAAEAHLQVARMARHMGRDDLCLQHLRMALLEKPNFTPARQLLDQVNGHPVAQVSAANR